MVFALLTKELTQHRLYIEPISVPKLMIENGYTPDVAARRLRDAINRVVTAAESIKHGPNVSLHGDQPDIVVPTVGIARFNCCGNSNFLAHHHPADSFR